MPFGLTTAPSVYQSINNVLASLMRQYSIPNVLYIGLVTTFKFLKGKILSLHIILIFYKIMRLYENSFWSQPHSTDDRCIICEPGEEYLGWLITSLSTSCGHFLSLHKTNVKESKPIFTYLGLEFDCPQVSYKFHA